MSDYMEIARRALERHQPEPESESMEAVLKGLAVELWSDVLGERLWLVADEEDAARLGEPRGSVYSAAEARMVCRITDPAIVREIHTYKQKFNATIVEHRTEGQR